MSYLEYLRTHQIVNAIGINSVVLETAYGLFCSEEGTSAIAMTDANVYMMTRRAHHYESCLIIQDLFDGIVATEGLNTESVKAMFRMKKIPVQPYNPDLILKYIPRGILQHCILNPEDDKYNESSVHPDYVLDGFSWYTVELACTRGNFRNVIRNKMEKGYDYFIVIYFGRGDTDYSDIEPNHIRNFNDIVIFTTIPLDIENVYIQLAERAREYKAAFDILDIELEASFMENDVLREVPYVNTRWVDVEVPQMSKKEVADYIWRSAKESSKLVEVGFTPRPAEDLRSSIRREHYQHTPFPLTLPGYKDDDPKTTMKNLEFGDVIYPGQHHAIKFSSLPPKIAAEAFVRRISVVLKGSVLDRSKDPSLKWEEAPYLISETPKDYFAGRGLSWKLNKEGKIGDYEFPEHKQSNIGKSFLIRHLATMRPRLKVPVLDKHIDACNQYDREKPKSKVHPLNSDSAKESTMKMEDLEIHDPLATKIHAFASAASVIFQSSGRFAEKDKDQTINCICSPVTIGRGKEQITYGYMILPNNHVKEATQRYMLWQIILAGPHFYVGVNDFTQVLVKNPDLKHAGLTVAYVRSYPVPKFKVYNTYSLPKSWLMAVGDLGDHRLEEETTGRSDNVNERLGLFKRSGYHACMIALDSNDLQGESSAMTKVESARKASRNGLKALVIDKKAWWKDVHSGPVDGVAGEFSQLVLESFREEVNPHARPAQDWSFMDDGQQYAIFNNGVPVMYDEHFHRNIELHGMIRVEDGVYKTNDSSKFRIDVNDDPHDEEMAFDFEIHDDSDDDEFDE